MGVGYQNSPNSISQVESIDITRKPDFGAEVSFAYSIADYNRHLRVLIPSLVGSVKGALPNKSSPSAHTALASDAAEIPQGA